MRVRLLGLRLLAAILTLLWGAAAALVLVGYRPGGPIDLLVGCAAALTIPVAAVAIRWPPLARGGIAFPAIAWIGIGSALVLAPSVAGLAGTVAARGPRTLLPSLEAGYPWLIALVGTACFSGLGVARRRLEPAARRRERLRLGGAYALAATLVVGGAFTAAAAGNDLALAGRVTADSRFGPVDGPAAPPPCDGPLAAGPAAVVGLAVEGRVDGRSIGSGRLSGIRVGDDLRWTARVETIRRLGAAGEARVDGRSWVLDGAGRWLPIDEPADENDLDARAVRVALAPEERIAAEDRGVSVVEGARARHCRIAIDGPTFADAFPEVGWFLAPGAELAAWRGELDYWVFLDGQLGRLSGSIGGAAVDAGLRGIAAELAVTLDAYDRDLPLTVAAPR
ncbi:MAG: hypothetical protein RL338_1839 [Chloroflexota bacterium]